MKKIIIELLEDEKSGGYTIISDDLYDGAVIAQGDNVIDALERFTEAIYDIEEYLEIENEK